LPGGAFLRPLAILYGAVARRRFENAHRYRPAIPVICVGNFTAGGTGKTPLTAHICERLIELGQSPAVLTRGYGGRLKGPHWVDLTRDCSKDVGDEPLLHAAISATIISKNRMQGAKEIERRREHSIIVMDDGLLNGSLEKDLSIAVLDGTRGVGNGEVIPAGPLRAPLEFQLGLVDCIVVNKGTGAALERALRLAGDLRRHFPGPVIETSIAPRGEVNWLSGQRIVAYAGIGSPQRFFELARAHGADIVRERIFPDHHVFQDADAGSLIAEAEACSAMLLTTEKDFARLAAAQGRCAELRTLSRVLPIKMVFEERDALRLDALLGAAIAHNNVKAKNP
jgi:tetraacyldisaccharide 4'-kinase